MKRNFQASFNGFHIDNTLGVRHDQAGLLKLQAKELAVLAVLVSHAGQLVTKEKILQSVWLDPAPSDSSIARCISRIKSNLNKAVPGSAALIKTIYGKGYVFDGDVAPSINCLGEDCLYTLINLSPDFIAFKDDQGRWIAANQTAVKVFNLEDTNWPGKTDLELAELLPSEYRSALEACAASDGNAWENNRLPNLSRPSSRRMVQHVASK